MTTKISGRSRAANCSRTSRHGQCLASEVPLSHWYPIAANQIDAVWEAPFIEWPTTPPRVHADHSRRRAVEEVDAFKLMPAKIRRTLDSGAAQHRRAPITESSASAAALADDTVIAAVRNRRARRICPNSKKCRLGPTLWMIRPSRPLMLNCSIPQKPRGVHSVTIAAWLVHPCDFHNAHRNRRSQQPCLAALDGFQRTRPRQLRVSGAPAACCTSLTHSPSPTDG